MPGGVVVGIPALHVHPDDHGAAVLRAAGGARVHLSEDCARGVLKNASPHVKQEQDAEGSAGGGKRVSYQVVIYFPIGFSR